MLPSNSPSPAAHAAEPKANCVHCGVSILLRTFTRTNGFCVPCGGDQRTFDATSKLLKIEQQQVVDEATVSSLMAATISKFPRTYHRWLRYLSSQESVDQFLWFRGGYGLPILGITVAGVLVMRDGRVVDRFFTSIDEGQEAAEVDGSELQPWDTGPEPDVVQVPLDPRQLVFPLDA